jgi:hypothetical protein
MYPLICIDKRSGNSNSKISVKQFIDNGKLYFFILQKY